MSKRIQATSSSVNYVNRNRCSFFVSHDEYHASSPLPPLASLVRDFSIKRRFSSFLSPSSKWKKGKEKKERGKKELGGEEGKKASVSIGNYKLTVDV